MTIITAPEYLVDSIDMRIDCFASIPLENRLNCETLYNSTNFFNFSNSTLQECLVELNYTLDEEFCDSEFESDRQVDLRYDCYERIGLERRKDREYCDIKYRRSLEEIFECVDYFQLPKGGEYCHFTYSWDNQFDELYECLGE